jgi:Rab GDP dissociation inhibitor
MECFKLDPSAQSFIGHAVVLEPGDEHLKQSPSELVPKMMLYGNSFTTFKDQNSPYLYPIYGLGDLPQAFARPCAVWGDQYAE